MTNFRGIYNEHVAAHALAFVLALSRNLPEYARWQQKKEWGPVKASTYLPEATALIVGLGGIGAETARLCAAFGMTVTGVDPRVKSPLRSSRPSIRPRLWMISCPTRIS